MPSTFFGLNIAVSGMSAYNAGLITTAHNISNVDTEGYSRQSINKKAGEAISLGTSYGMLGSGTVVTDIESSRDAYYDYKYRKANSVYGKYETQNYYMSTIEDYLYVNDSDSGGLTNTLDNFFTALTSLTTDASDTTIRSEVTGYAETLASYANEAYTNLSNLQKTVNTEIADQIEQINSYAKQITALNKEINTLEVYGGTANDLRDQRAELVDELSAIVNVDVTEQESKDNGINQYIVYIDGSILVDTYDCNTLKVTTRTTKNNQSDIDGLYDISWSNGQDFNMSSKTLGGTLQGLLETRDGNNGECFSTTFSSYSKSNASYNGSSTVTLVTDSASSSNSTDLSLLNIPESNGVITIANAEYKYDSFSVSVSADGTYTYTFVLSDTLSDSSASSLQKALTDGKTTSTIGDEVEYRGIPYYQQQINEFVRTFAASFNEVQNAGYDTKGNLGKDLFVAKDKTTSDELEMNEFLYHEEDGYYYINGSKVVDSTSKASLTAKGYTFTAITGSTNYYTMTDKSGNSEKVYIPDSDTSIYTFNSLSSSGSATSYYSMTAQNFKAASALVEDGSLLACAQNNPTTTSGTSEGKNLAKMVALETDTSMFKQGDPDSFLSVMTATLGVDGAKAKDSSSNSKNILDSIETMRTSVSGVDEDEEAQNLVTYQNLLNYQYQVISVMNEVLDKLINGTGV